MEMSTLVRPRRLIKMLAIALGCVLAFNLLLLAAVLSSDTFSALAWHLRHGKTITFSGFVFNVPFDVKPIIDRNGQHLKLLKINQVRGRVLSLDATAEGPTLSTQQIMELHQRSLNIINSRGTWQMTAETIQGSGITYICLRDEMRLANFGSMGETLSCHIPGTNLQIFTSAGPKDAMQARLLLIGTTTSK